MLPSFCRCLRLGLTPLAYLWRRDQDSLLSDMISTGLHAILIKVAAFGEFVSLPHQSHKPSAIVQRRFTAGDHG